MSENISGRATKLLQERRIFPFTRDIERDSLNEFRGFFFPSLLRSADPVIFLFDSPGGDVEIALNVFDMIKLSKIQATGLVVGQCSSAATYILQACRSRLALPHARFMLHHIVSTFSFCPSEKEEDIERRFQYRLAASQRLNAQVMRIYAQRTGRSIEEVREWMSRGTEHNYILDADEAKELGLIDDIVTDFPAIANLAGALDEKS